MVFYLLAIDARGVKEPCALSYSCIRKSCRYCYSSQGNKGSPQLSNTHLKQACGHENRSALFCLILLFQADDAPWLCWSRLLCDHEAHLTRELIRLKSSLNINECMDIFVAVLAYRHTGCSFPDAKNRSPSWSHVAFFSAPEALISKDKAQEVKEQDEPPSPALTLPVKEETINPLSHWGAPEFWESHVPPGGERLPCGGWGDPRTASLDCAMCPATSTLSAARGMCSKGLRGKCSGIRVRKSTKLFYLISKTCYMEFNWSSQCTGWRIEMEFFTQYIFHRMN